MMKDSFAQYYNPFLEDVCDCVDRIVLNAYLPLASSAGGFRCWWRLLWGNDENLSDQTMRSMAGDFSRRISAFTKQHNIPLIEAPPGARKDELVAPFIPESEQQPGVFCVVTGNAPAPVWRIVRNAKGQITRLHTGTKSDSKKWSFVKHYHIHIMDKAWGHVIIRICGYPPFKAQVILNGHQWVNCTASSQGIPRELEGNTFVSGSDFTSLDSLAGRLEKEEGFKALEQVCERWIYSSALIFGLTLEQQKKVDARYAYSIYQLELSRDYHFHSGRTMDEVFQGLLDRTRRLLDMDRLKTIFGARNRPPRRGKTSKLQRRSRRGAETSKEVNGNEYDLTVFKLHFKNLTVKLYDKSERSLRAEIVVHNAKTLKSNRGLGNWPSVLEEMRGMLNRFMEQVNAIHRGLIDQGRMESWPQASREGKNRLAGIDLNKARNRALIDSLAHLSITPQGFNRAELVEEMRKRGVEGYSEQKASYDLMKVRAKGWVEKIPKSRRNQSHAEGLRELYTCVCLREKILKPLIGLSKNPGEEHESRYENPLDKLYENIGKTMIPLFEYFGLAA